MDLISQVTMLGGACLQTTLHQLREDAEIGAAVGNGTLVLVGRHRYALATTTHAVKTAASVSGVLSHRSAARRHGWAQFKLPTRPEVSIPRTKRLRTVDTASLIPHWIDLEPHEVEGMWTTKERTLRDCMRNLPFDESLAIVNSAIRADDFTPEDVRRIAANAAGRGRVRMLEVAAAADGKPANPFESALIAQAHLVPGLQVHAQWPVSVPGSKVVLHPDAADPVRKIAIEAEGFEWHGDKAQLTRDCRRYNTLGVLGWLVIRFSWQLVRFEAAYVQETLLAAVAERS